LSARAAIAALTPPPDVPVTTRSTTLCRGTLSSPASRLAVHASSASIRKSSAPAV
jgi:hypothetical protein